MTASYLSHNEMHLRAVVVVYAGLLTPDVACPHNHQPAMAKPLSDAHIALACQARSKQMALATCHSTGRLHVWAQAGRARTSRGVSPG